MKKIKLFYLPYAGGSAQLCRSWQQYLGDDIEVKPMEIAGRGTRFKDRMYESMEEAAEDLLERSYEDMQSPYMIYGHSFGALLTYELYYRICEKGMKPPDYLFFSGSLPPNRRRANTKIYDMPKEEFIKEIQRFNGMEEEILKNWELMQIVLPILRADFKILDTYCFMPRKYKIISDATILYGNDMTYEEVAGWQELLEGKITFQHMQGDHFFIKDNKQKVLEMIKAQAEKIKVEGE